MKKIFTYLMAIPIVFTMAIATGCQNPEPPAPTPTPDPTKSPTISLSEVTEARTINSATITVAVTNADKFKYAYYPKDTRPTDVEWIVYDKVTKDGEYEVVIKDLKADIAKSTDYTFEAFACLKDSVSKAKTLDFKTLQAQVVNATDFRVSSSKISFVGACLPEYCDGFFWAIVPQADYSRENFINNCEFDPLEGKPLNGLVKEEGVCVLGFAFPETDYVIAIQPIIVSEDGIGYDEKVGDVIEIEKTTPRYALNQGVVTPVEFTLKSAAKPLSIDLKAGITEGADIGGCYFGAIKKSELGGKAISDYITESDWFYAHPASAPEMSNYNVICLFNEGDVEVSQGLSVEPNTEYVAFVIPLDKDGFVGAAQSLDVKTPVLSYEDKAKAAVTLTPTRSGAKVAVEFLEGCSRLYYVVEEKGTITLEEAVAKMVVNASNVNPFECWTAQDQDIQIYGKKPLTQYDVFLLPMSEQGNFGAPVHMILETATDQITVDPSIVMSIVSVGEPKAGSWGAWLYDCQVSLGANAASYGWGQVDSALEGLGENPTAIQLASSLYNEWGFAGVAENLTELTQEASLMNFTGAAHDYYLVFIPKDGDGKLGTPVFQKVSVPISPVSAPSKRR